MRSFWMRCAMCGALAAACILNAIPAARAYSVQPAAEPPSAAQTASGPVQMIQNVIQSAWAPISGFAGALKGMHDVLTGIMSAISIPGHGGISPAGIYTSVNGWLSQKTGLDVTGVWRGVGEFFIRTIGVIIAALTWMARFIAGTIRVVKHTFCDTFEINRTTA